MEYRVTVNPQVRARFRTFGLGRTAGVKVFTDLHHTLRHHADQFRPNRHPEDPDLFVYQHVFLDEAGRAHTVVFGVNDTRDPVRLFVESVDHIAPQG